VRKNGFCFGLTAQVDGFLPVRSVFLRPAFGVFGARYAALDGGRELFLFIFSAASESRRKDGLFSRLSAQVESFCLVKSDVLDGGRELFLFIIAAASESRRNYGFFSRRIAQVESLCRVKSDALDGGESVFSKLAHCLKFLH